MLRTRVTELFDIEYPIIQGGMAFLALGQLAAAVSNAGGLGQISALTIPNPEEFREEIRKAKKLTSKPIGVNLAVGYLPYDAYIDVAIEEGIRIASLTGGNPEAALKRLKSAGFKAMVDVGGVRHARKAEELGADAVTAIGYEAGGHIGRYDTTTMVLVPRLAETIKVPVIAGGGIGDARGFVAALALGAEGVMMGTRFILTQECSAHPNYKQALLQASETDTTIVTKTMGQPGRALHNPAVEVALQMEANGVSREEIYPFVAGEGNRRAAVDGDLSAGTVWAGQVIGLIHDMPTIHELIEGMVAEALEIEQKLHRQFEAFRLARASS